MMSALNANPKNTILMPRKRDWAYRPLQGARSGVRCCLFSLLAVAAFTPVFSSTSEVVATEKAFEQATLTGIKDAFLKFAAPDGVMFLPDPVIVVDNPGLVDWKGSLTWAPDLIIASKSKDLYVSTGPAVFTSSSGGRRPNAFVTLWARQPDGTLRFRLDRGIDQPALKSMASDTRRKYQVIRGSTGPTAPNVTAMELALANGSSSDAREAIATRLHPKGRVLRAGRFPMTPAEWSSLTDQPSRIDYTLLASGASSARDLAWSYGKAAWSVGEKPRTGYFFRAWVHDRGVWRIALDDLTER